MKLFRKKSLLPGAPDSRGGITVTQAPPLVRLGDSATSHAALYRESPAVRAVIDFLSSNLAQIPIHGYQRAKSGDRERLPAGNPLEALLRRPNGRTTGYRLRRDLVADLALAGNAYWIKVRDAEERVGALVRVPPATVSLVRTDETEVSAYRIQFGSGAKEWAADDLAHFKLYAPDGLLGAPPLDALRYVLAEDRAASEHRTGFWRNAARREGVIERPLEAPEWGDDARDRFLEDWAKLTSGEANSGRTAVVEEGMRYRESSFSPRDSEFIDGRKLTLAFVASVYDVPLQLLGGTDRNVDAAARSLLQNTLAPWLSLIEEELDLQLLPDLFGEQAANGRIFTEHTLQEKIRGSFLQEAQIVEQAVGGAYMTVNEARAMRNMPPVENGDALREPRPQQVVQQ